MLPNNMSLMVFGSMQVKNFFTCLRYLPSLSPLPWTNTELITC